MLSKRFTLTIAYAPLCIKLKRDLENCFYERPLQAFNEVQQQGIIEMNRQAHAKQLLDQTRAD